jgi:RimJ/RimL family protein N-acetyltransferase
MTLIAQTQRLRVRRFVTDDAPFIVELLNDPGWIRYIGKRNVRTIEDAKGYLAKGPIDMYARLGFGLYLVELVDTREPIGMCGLIKRPALEDVDIGFAFLPRYAGQGYAFEAATAVMAHARALGLDRIVAIVTRDNERSRRLLDRLGFRFERLHESGGETLELYAAGG